MKTVYLRCIILLLLLVLILFKASAQDPIKSSLPADREILYEYGSKTDIKFSPEGTRLAVAGTAGIMIYDVSTGKELSWFANHTNGVGRINFLPDGATIVGESRGIHSSIQLWDVATGELKQTLIEGDIYDSVFIKVFSLSPDGTTFARAGKFDDIQLWDVSTGEHLRTLGGHLRTLWGHKDEIKSVSFSPDGTTLASGSADTTVRLWDVSIGGHLRTFVGHSDEIKSISFSPDGTTLASGSADTTVRLWDVSTGKHLRTLRGHKDKVQSVSFSPDGTTLFTVSWDKTIRLWDALTGEYLKTIKRPRGSVAFSPDGTTIAIESGDGVLLTNLEFASNEYSGVSMKDVLISLGIIVATVCFGILLTRKTRAFLKEHSSQLSSEDPKVLLELTEKCEAFLKDRQSNKVANLSRQAKAKIDDIFLDIFLKEHSALFSSKDPKVLLGLTEKCEAFLIKNQHSDEVAYLSQLAKAKASRLQKEIDLETFKSEISEDGSHPSVVATLKENMHNPDSFQHVSSDFETIKQKGKSYHKIEMTFRATNTFNALVLQTCYFLVDEDNQITLVGSPDSTESSPVNTVSLAEAADTAVSAVDGATTLADLLAFFTSDEE